MVDVMVLWLELELKFVLNTGIIIIDTDMNVDNDSAKDENMNKLDITYWVMVNCRDYN